MKSTICDICQRPIGLDDMYCIKKHKRPFEVLKKQRAFDGTVSFWQYDNIDLCSLCYSEMIEIVKERIRTENHDI